LSDVALPAVMTIDGGNSKTDVALVADDGTVLASLRGPGVSHEDFGLEEAMRRLGEIVRAVAAQVGRPAGDGLVARHTSACLAGADLPEEETMLTAAIGRQGWSRTAAVANDTFAVLRTGLTPGEGEPAWGIAVTCGSRRLDEVRICLSRDLQFRDCAETNRRSCRRDRLVMPPVRGNWCHCGALTGRSFISWMISSNSARNTDASFSDSGEHPNASMIHSTPLIGSIRLRS